MGKYPTKAPEVPEPEKNAIIFCLAVTEEVRLHDESLK